MLPFASCGQCSQDSLKESWLFPSLTSSTAGAHPRRHSPLCRSRRWQGGAEWWWDASGPVLVSSLPSRHFPVWLHPFSTQSGTVLTAKCSVCIELKRHVEKNIQRTSIWKKTCKHIYVHKEKCGKELALRFLTVVAGWWNHKWFFFSFSFFSFLKVSDVLTLSTWNTY